MAYLYIRRESKEQQERALHVPRKEREVAMYRHCEAARAAH